MTDETVVDVLVIGGGPAGTVTGGGTASAGLSTLILEKRAEVGIPVRCGEGISREVLDIIGSPPDPSFVAKEIEGARIISPGGMSVTLGPEMAGPETGFTIHRDRFDRHLAERAILSGADLWVNAEAVSFKSESGYGIVDCYHLGKRERIRANVVVAADGFESLVASWAGLATRLQMKDIDTCLQYEMKGVYMDMRYTHFFVGRRFAPGGYVWVFPKAEDIANVGLGLNGSMVEKGGEPKRYLDHFIRNSEGLRDAVITEVNGGAVSVSLPLETTVADNMVVVGDAARMIDPLTGGGIYNACVAAKEAVKAIENATVTGSFDSGSLASYETGWRDKLEFQMARNYLAKEKLLQVDDNVIDKVLGAISEYDLTELSTEELLKAVAAKYPGVMDGLKGLI